MERIQYGFAWSYGQTLDYFELLNRVYSMSSDAFHKNTLFLESKLHQINHFPETLLFLASTQEEIVKQVKETAEYLEGVGWSEFHVFASNDRAVQDAIQCYRTTLEILDSKASNGVPNDGKVALFPE